MAVKSDIEIAQEAKLLNIAIGSVSRKHTRLKGKLNITLPSNSTLYEYLMINMG